MIIFNNNFVLASAMPTQQAEKTKMIKRQTGSNKKKLPVQASNLSLPLRFGEVNFKLLIEDGCANQLHQLTGKYLLFKPALKSLDAHFFLIC